MRQLWMKLRLAARTGWQGLRQWSGDAAYETYVRCAIRNGNAGLLTREQFYVEQLNRKYSRPNRCC
jgi:uncharacterized short protein YbdD (DUF466 family)